MLPQTKAVVAINAVTGSSAGSITSSAIDTLGARFASIDIWATTQSASTQAGSPSGLKLQESDSTSATTFVDIVGFRGASAAATNVDFVVPIGVTSGVNNYKFNVDLRGRKRYLSIVIGPTTTQTFYAVANLARTEQSPSTAAKAGVLALIEG